MPGEKEKSKEDIYQKALVSYGKAMKAFHKGDYKRAYESLKMFLNKYNLEKELVDRARIYLEICKGRQKKETMPLKTLDDYYQYSVYKINQGEYEESIKLLKKALEKNPKDGKIYYLIASAFCLFGKTKECAENLSKAIEIDDFFKILAQNESDFEELREDNEFRQIAGLE